MKELLTNNGLLITQDYLALFFAVSATIWLQWYNTKQSIGEDFKLKVFAHENYPRWISSFAVGTFLLYIAPDLYFMIVEDYMKIYEKGQAHWNVGLSGLIGLSPLYIFKKIVKISRSKFRDNVED